MYIYDLLDWPNLQWAQERLSDRLGSVRHRQGRLIGRMEALGFRLRGEANLLTLTADVLMSSEIEGDTLDREQVRLSIARRLGMDVGALKPSGRHVDGVVEMMLDATQNFESPLTAERLYGWHAALFPAGHNALARSRVGQWRDDRDGPMRVLSGPSGKERVHFQAPAAERLKGEMRAFLAWFNGADGSDAVLKAGVAHLWFVTIHPFDDGNGRMARAIADMTLARSEGGPQRFYSMSRQIRAERNVYYEILERTQRGSLDITEWLAWFLDCLDRAVTGAETMLEDVLRKARFWELHGSAAFSERQRDMLSRLLDGFEGKLTSSKWATIEKCSQDTASREIDDLLQRGILLKNPGGGRSTSYGLVEVE